MRFRKAWWVIAAGALGLSLLRPCLPAPTLIPREGIVIYVSPDGKDTWSGRFPIPEPRRPDGPFRTIERARDAIRQLKAQGKFNDKVFVCIRSGTYELKEPLVFTPEDSGTPEHPIVYTSYLGEAPVVSGGRHIAEIHPSVTSGPSGRGPEHDITIHPEDITDWVSPLGVLPSGYWDFHELFVNGQRRTRARAPNSGFYFVDGKISGGDPATFKYHPGDIHASWAARGDVEVVALLKWGDFRSPIKAVDEATHTVTLARKRQDYGDDENPRYWVENAREISDAPGEWYLDPRDRVLEYRPFPGEDIHTNPVVAPFLTQLVRFVGDPEHANLVHDITLRGLTFAYTDWKMPPSGYADEQSAYDLGAAVELCGAAQCTLDRLLFTHLGEYALWIHAGSSADSVTRSTLTDLGAGGIKMGDAEIPARENLATAGIIVSDNQIFDIGKVFPAAVGVWIGQSGGNTISHNDIHDTYYTGISAGWTWGYGPTAARANRIEFNRIYNIGREMLSDMGCIYTLGVQPGTVERGNVCHDVRRYARGYGGWGIYTDEGSSDIVIENNIVYRAQDGGFHQHYGRENTVRNNIFAFGETAQIRRTRDEPHSSFTFERNVILWKDGRLLDGNWDDGNYRFDHNFYFKMGGTGAEALRFGLWAFDEWQKRGEDQHSLVADPHFFAPDLDDFSLRPDSPLLKLGFQPLDLGGAGPRP